MQSPRDRQRACAGPVERRLTNAVRQDTRSRIQADDRACGRTLGADAPTAVKTCPACDSPPGVAPKPPSKFRQLETKRAAPSTSIRSSLRAAGDVKNRSQSPQIA